MLSVVWLSVVAGALAATPPRAVTSLVAGLPDGLESERPIRLVVLACSRDQALSSLLASIASVGEHGGYVGHNVDLEIKVDIYRNKTTHSKEVLDVAYAFNWPYGNKTVSPRPTHGGILGQWLGTKPKDENDWFVVLEDDLAVSPCFYKYLLRVRREYGNREDLAGFTLQDMATCHLSQGCLKPEFDTVHLSKIVGSWGFMPRPKSWMQFTEWQSKWNTSDPTSMSSVNLPANLMPTTWYHELTAAGKADSMWTIWHIAYSNAFQKMTMVPHYSHHLSVTHGSQESEHGNENGRLPMLSRFMELGMPEALRTSSIISYSQVTRRAAGIQHEPEHHTASDIHGLVRTSHLAGVAGDDDIATLTSPDLSSLKTVASVLLQDCGELPKCCSGVQPKAYNYDLRQLPSWPSAEPATDLMGTNQLAGKGVMDTSSEGASAKPEAKSEANPSLPIAIAPATATATSAVGSSSSATGSAAVNALRDPTPPLGAAGAILASKPAGSTVACYGPSCKAASPFHVKINEGGILKELSSCFGPSCATSSGGSGGASTPFTPPLGNAATAFSSKSGGGSPSCYGAACDDTSSKGIVSCEGASCAKGVGATGVNERGAIFVSNPHPAAGIAARGWTRQSITINAHDIKPPVDTKVSPPTTTGKDTREVRPGSRFDGAVILEGKGAKRALDGALILEGRGDRPPAKRDAGSVPNVTSGGNTIAADRADSSDTADANILRPSPAPSPALSLTPATSTDLELQTNASTEANASVASYTWMDVGAPWGSSASQGSGVGGSGMDAGSNMSSSGSSLPAQSNQTSDSWDQSGAHADDGNALLNSSSVGASNGGSQSSSQSSQNFGGGQWDDSSGSGGMGSDASGSRQGDGSWKSNPGDTNGQGDASGGSSGSDSSSASSWGGAKM